MDQELIAFLEQRFQGMEATFRTELQTFREETSQRFDQVDDKVNLARVEIESVRGEVRQVADGVAANTEKLDAFRVEVAREFAEVRMTSRLQYTDLDRRVRRLEGRILEQA